MRRNNQKRSKRSKKLSSRPRDPLWHKPPTYKSQNVRSWMIRCDVASNASEQIITTFQLSSLLAVIATSATTSVFLTDSWRLKKIDMWSYTPNIGTTVDIMIKFADNGTAAGQGGPPCTKMDSSASIDDPAYVSLRPPKGSVCSLWQDTGVVSYNFFTFLSPQQSVMDLYFDFIIDDIGGLAAGPALGGATTGNIYHHPVSTLTPVQPLNRA